jgi:hypothetical protein
MPSTGRLVRIKPISAVWCFLIVVFLILTPISVIEPASSNSRSTADPVDDVKNETAWMKIFYGEGFDIGYSVQQTADGGYIVAGETSSQGAGDADCWLIKTDKYGDEEWNRTHGGIYDDVAYSVQQTADGGYIIAGATHSFEKGGIDVDGYPSSDVWIIKTDPKGVEEWNRSYFGVFWDFGYSVQQTLDGGFIVLANLALDYLGFYDIWLIKLDKNGEEEWNRTHGTWKNDMGYSIQQTSDGGYIITGETDRYTFGDPTGPYYTESDIWLLKTDEAGNEQWNRTFGGNQTEYANEVKQTGDNGFIIVGTRGYFFNNLDIWLIKTNETGEEQWNRTFGVDNYNDDIGYSVDLTHDGGYVITGMGKSTCSWSSSICLIRTNETGILEWDKTYGGGYEEIGYSVNATTDGGFIMTGSQDYDVILIKTDTEGPARSISKATVTGRITGTYMDWRTANIRSFSGHLTVFYILIM